MANDARRFIYNSDYPMPYFIYKTSTSVTAPSRGTATVSIDHNLGFTPLIVGQWSETSDFKVTHDITNSTAVNATYCWSFANSTNVYIRQFNGKSSSNTIYVRIWAYAPADYDGDLQPISDETAFEFNTDYTYLGLYADGYIEPDNQVHDIAHNLGYVPLCRVWCGGIFAVDGQSSVKAITPVSSRVFTSLNYQSWVVDDTKLSVGNVSTYDGRTYYHIYTNEA